MNCVTHDLMMHVHMCHAYRHTLTRVQRCAITHVASSLTPSCAYGTKLHSTGYTGHAIVDCMACTISSEATSLSVHVLW